MRPGAIRTPDVRGGTALLVIEVADTSWQKDAGPKATRYAAFGVREYWLVDAETLATLVHRSPAVGAYASITEVAADESLVSLLVPALTVRLADLDL